MSRRRYFARVACEGCGRLLGEQEITGHVRACAKWRKRATEEGTSESTDPTAVPTAEDDETE